MLTNRFEQLRRSTKKLIHSWSWAKIKCELEMRGHTLASLAEKSQVSRQAFSKVKNCISAPAQQVIADALGVEPQAIWPHRYRRDA